MKIYWWFENFEIEIAPETYLKDIDPKDVVPGNILTIQMMVDVALGSDEEANKYSDYLMKCKDRTV